MKAVGCVLGGGKTHIPDTHESILKKSLTKMEIRLARIEQTDSLLRSRLRHTDFTHIHILVVALDDVGREATTLFARRKKRVFVAPLTQVHRGSFIITRDNDGRKLLATLLANRMNGSLAILRLLETLCTHIDATPIAQTNRVSSTHKLAAIARPVRTTHLARRAVDRLMIDLTPTRITQIEDNTIKPAEDLFSGLVMALLTHNRVVHLCLTFRQVHPTSLTHGVCVRLVHLLPNTRCRGKIAIAARHPDR